jgi:hypothetical protein
VVRVLRLTGNIFLAGSITFSSVHMFENKKSNGNGKNTVTKSFLTAIVNCFSHIQINFWLHQLVFNLPVATNSYIA